MDHRGVLRADPRARADGRVIRVRRIDRARDDGAFAFDFLRGREPYKYAWGAVERRAHAARVALTGRRSS